MNLQKILVFILTLGIYVSCAVAQRTAVEAVPVAIKTHPIDGDIRATIDKMADELEAKVIKWRRHLHENPELSNREFKTAEMVAKHLKSLGIEVQTKVGENRSKRRFKRRKTWSCSCFYGQIWMPYLLLKEWIFLLRLK